MPYEIIDGDITKINVDVIINSTSKTPSIGDGVDHSIFSKGEPKLCEDRLNCGILNTTQVCLTKAYDLLSKYVIHLNGPIYIDGKHHEKEDLYQTYWNALSLVKQYNLKSIAFPLISSENYKFPRGQALSIALDAIKNFLNQYEMMVYLIIYDDRENQVSNMEYQVIKNYLHKYYENDDLDLTMNNLSSDIVSSLYLERNLDELEFERDITFQEAIFKILDQKGLNDVEVYQKANIDRRLFSKIKSDNEYHPSKITAIAFGFAMELNLDEVKDLLLKAGYALSRSSIFELIVTYCIEEKIYDLNEINRILFAFDQRTIGCID